MNNPYDSIADDWQVSRTTFGAKKYIDLILSNLRPGVKLLDLGCGTGVPIAQYVIQNGFSVVRVDQSASMLEIARRDVPKAELIQANMCDVNFAREFAAVIAWDSVFHLERARHQAIFHKIFAVLEPDGWLLLSVGGSGQRLYVRDVWTDIFL